MGTRIQLLACAATATIGALTLLPGGSQRPSSSALVIEHAEARAGGFSLREEIERAAALAPVLTERTREQLGARGATPDSPQPAAPSLAAAQAPAPGYLAGRVLAPLGGNMPLGCRIEARSSGLAHSVPVDLDGSFSFLVSGGRWSVRALADEGHSSDWISTLVHADRVSAPALVLDMRQRWIVEGRLVDLAGNALEGWRIGFGMEHAGKVPTAPLQGFQFVGTGPQGGFHVETAADLTQLLRWSPSGNDMQEALKVKPWLERTREGLTLVADDACTLELRLASPLGPLSGGTVVVFESERLERPRRQVLDRNQATTFSLIPAGNCSISVNSSAGVLLATPVELHKGRNLLKLDLKERQRSAKPAPSRTVE